MSRSPWSASSRAPGGGSVAATRRRAYRSARSISRRSSAVDRAARSPSAVVAGGSSVVRSVGVGSAEWSVAASTKVPPGRNTHPYGTAPRRAMGRAEVTEVGSLRSGRAGGLGHRLGRPVWTAPTRRRSSRRGRCSPTHARGSASCAEPAGLVALPVARTSRGAGGPSGSERDVAAPLLHWGVGARSATAQASAPPPHRAGTSAARGSIGRTPGWSTEAKESV
jgi:hypothetical protein